MNWALYLIMTITLSWAPQPYNWHLCYSEDYYNVFVPAKFQCIVAKGPLGTRAIKLNANGETWVKRLPKIGLKDCLTGPNVMPSDICVELYDLDYDAYITLRDVAIYANQQHNID